MTRLLPNKNIGKETIINEVSVQEKIILEAARLILLKGVRATSVNEILAKSHAGKGQFYHYFTSKNDLIKKLILSYGCKVFDSHIGSLAKVNSLKEFLQWVNDSFHVAKVQDKIGGCLIGAIANEVGHMGDEVMDEIQTLLNDWKKIISAKIDELKAKKYFINETPSEELAEFLLIIFEGSALFCKVYQNQHKVKIALKNYCLYLQIYISPEHKIDLLSS